MSDLYEFINEIEPDPVYVCDLNKSQCRGSELCHKPGGCFYTTDKDRALDPSTPLYMAESLIKVVSTSLDKLRAEIKDAISRKAALEKAINVPIAKVVTEDEVIYRKVIFADDIENLPPVMPDQTGHCKDCKFFEYDSVAKVDEIPLIVAHEICQRWGDGCKTKEDGYCFLFEPKERSDDEST